MAYRLTQFDTVALPMAAPRGDLGTPPANELIVSLPDGRFVDAYGSGVAPFKLPYALSWQCEAFGITPDELTATLDALRALTTHRCKLYLDDTGGGATRWAWARLQRENQPWEWNRIYTQPIALTWTVESLWYGPALIGNTAIGFWSDDSFLMLKVDDWNPYTLVIAIYNDGNQNGSELVITVSAGSAPITAITLTNTTTGHAWTYTGTIAAGKQLVVRCDMWSVKNDSVDDLAHFTEPATFDDWMQIVPGNNVLTVSITGGSADSRIDPEFWPTWA